MIYVNSAVSRGITAVYAEKLLVQPRNWEYLIHNDGAWTFQTIAPNERTKDQ